MSRRGIAAIIGAVVLCMAAAGCGTQTQTATNGTEEAAAAAASATTSAAAAATEAPAEEEDMSWQEADDAYLTGVKASDYVELPVDYKHLEIEAARPEDPTDEDVDNYIEAELQNRATSEEVDRRVKEGDTVSIDYVGKMNGKEFEGGTGSYDLVIGSDAFIEGFEEGLIGAKKGETRDINLTFPEDYHPEAGLNGKDVVFTVTVNAIKENKVPELTNDYVKSLNLTNAFGQAVSSVNDYREYVRSNLIESGEETFENTVKSQIVSKLLKDSSFKQEPPANMVEKYNYLLKRQLSYYALQNYTDLPTLMSVYYGATEDNYLDMIRDMAKNYADQGLILQAVADDKDLNPDEDKVTTAIAGYVAEDATVEKAEDLDRVIRESLRDDLMTDNVIDYLYRHCKISETSEDEEKEEGNASTAVTAEAAETAGTAASAQAETAAASEKAAEDASRPSEDGDSEKDAGNGDAEDKEKDSEDKDSEDKNSEDNTSDQKDSDNKDKDTGDRD